MRKIHYLSLLLIFIITNVHASYEVCRTKLLDSVPAYYEAQVLPTISLSRKLFSRVEKSISNTELLCRLNLGDQSVLDELVLNSKAVKVYFEDEKKLMLEIKKNLEMKQTNELALLYIDLKSIESSLKGDVWKVQAYENKVSNWLKVSALKSPSEHLYKLIENNKVFSNFDQLKVYIEYISEKYPINTLIFIFSIVLFVFSMFFNFPVLGNTLLVLTTSIPVVFRIIISQRAPVTNMYETVLFGAFSISIFSLFLQLKKVDLTKVASLFVALSYGLLIFGHDLFNSNVKLLRPVLRDDIWLSTHVTLIVFAYGVFSASWIYSFFNLAKKSYDQRGKEITLNLVKIGLIFLFAGTVLGAIWADKAWGRFWGWDPKETWALISIAIYTAVIHLNYKKPLTPEKTYILVFSSYSSIIMAWFGVNYLIATGMHTYGFQEGKGVSFVLLFLFTQLGCGIYFLYRRKV